MPLKFLLHRIVELEGVNDWLEGDSDYHNMTDEGAVDNLRSAEMSADYKENEVDKERKTFNLTLCVPCIILQRVNDQRDAQFL